MTTLRDNEPFDVSRAPLDFGLVRNDVGGTKAHAEVLRAMRRRVEQWGVARGFDVVEHGIVCTTESVDVTIAFSETTAEICTLHATALQPAELRLSVEPKSWTDWIAARLGHPFETADRAFDEHWHVETSDEEVAKHLLDARARSALIQHPIWCRLVYVNGRLDVQLDSGEEKLTGQHLLAAIEVTVALARAVPRSPAAPYR